MVSDADARATAPVHKLRLLDYLERRGEPATDAHKKFILQHEVQWHWPALENFQGRQAKLDSPAYCLAYLRLAFPKGASVQSAGLTNAVEGNKRKRRVQRPGDEPLPEPSQAGAADQAAAGSEGQSDRDAQQPGASSDVADMEAHLTLQEDGQPGSGRAPVGARRAATSASAGQPAAAEVPEEPTSAAECPAAAEGLQKLMPAAGQPEWQPEHQPEPARKRQQRAAKPKQQAEPARKRQRRAVKPGRRAAGAAAEPVEVAAAVRQLAVLASPGEHGSARDLPALGAIEQEGNDGQWDSAWDVQALRGAMKNIEGARKVKVVKLRADQEQERRDMEARHKRAVEEVNEEAKQQQADAEEAAVRSLQLKLMACSRDWQACQDAWRQAQGRLAGQLLEQFAQELRVTEECFRQQALRELSPYWSSEHKSRRRRKT